MKKSFLIISALMAAFQLHAQDISSVLKQIEQNNLQLKAAGYEVKAQQLELQTANNLPDPEVEYVYQWGSTATTGNETELTVTQAFDFPTAYAERSKYRKLQSQALDRGTQQVAQSIKLQAAQLCIKIISLNQRKALLESILENLQKQMEIAQKAEQGGNLEAWTSSKLRMRMMGIEAELQMNNASHAECLSQLFALNGGKNLEFTSAVYPELPSVINDPNALLDDYRANDAANLRMMDELKAGEQKVKVARAEGLPKMHLGYQRNTATGESLNGVVGGLSIPLFSNRGKVKVAKAEQLSRQLQVQEEQLQHEMGINALFAKKNQLETALKKYDRSALMKQHSLLDKSLELREITILDYLTEIHQMLDIELEAEKLEQEYQQTCYELLKYRL